MSIDTPANLLQTNRLIYKRSASREIPDLLQNAFAAEILSPGPCVWIVSAWIWDIPVLDNSTGGFFQMNPAWPFGPIRLVEVLDELLSQGTTVHLAVRPRVNDIFLQTLFDKTGHRPPDSNTPLKVHRVGEEKLHQKGILTSRFYLRGSMNLTHNGIQVFDEHVEYTTATDAVATAQIEFEARWGGESQ